jgi:protein O-mannosyl-transferase
VTSDPFRLAPTRLGLIVVLLAVAAYANAVPNGFAYDDTSIVQRNDLVTSGDVLGAFSAPYWPHARGGAGLYRPVTIASFAAEWALWGDAPAGFHAVNLALHAVVSLLGFLLLLQFVVPVYAALGAAVFAVHPLHVEAVANVVGRSELLAAIFVLLACLLHLRDAGGPRHRGLRWAALVVLYLAGLGAKEMAVTLPGLLLLLSCGRDGWVKGLKRGAAEWPLYLLFSVALVTYLTVRGSVVGSVVGELPAAYLGGLSTVQRLLTAVSVWPQYLRLLVFPMDLVAEYGPAVLLPARTFDADVLKGVLVGVAGVWLAVRSWRQAPAVSLGVAWFSLAVLPVSNVLFPIGILLAERTMYLPSLGFSFVVAGGMAWLIDRRPQSVRWVWVVASTAVILMLSRTVSRNPSWMSTFAVLDTLSNEHPESFLSVRARATGFAAVGEYEEASRYYEIALEMAPDAFDILLEVGRFYGERERWARAEELLTRATAIFPVHPAGWQARSEQLLLQGRGREAHRVALEGLRKAGPDRELWILVSESYVAKGDYAASARARVAALGAEEETSKDWLRLAEILEMDGRSQDAAQARERGRALRRNESETEDQKLNSSGVPDA